MKDLGNHRRLLPPRILTNPCNLNQLCLCVYLVRFDALCVLTTVHSHASAWERDKNANYLTIIYQKATIPVQAGIYYLFPSSINKFKNSFNSSKTGWSKFQISFFILASKLHFLPACFCCFLRQQSNL